MPRRWSTLLTHLLVLLVFAPVLGDGRLITAAHSQLGSAPAEDAPLTGGTSGVWSQSPRVKFLSQTGGAMSAVAASGTYVYVGMGPRLVILDMSNPASPIPIAQSDPFPELIRGITLEGHYAYVSDGSAGLGIVDLADPSNPSLVAAVAPISAESVALAGRYAYVVGTALWDRDGQQSLPGGLRVIDVSDPAHPTQVGFVAIAGVGEHYDPWRVALVGSYAYVAAGPLAIVDVSDPTAPRLTAPSRWIKVSDVAVAGRYAYLAGNDRSVRILDVSNPGAPVEVGSHRTGTEVRAIAVANDHVYFAGASTWSGKPFGGLGVIEGSNPARPVQIGWLSTERPSTGVALAAGYAYIIEHGSALNVIDVKDARNPLVSARYSPPVGNRVVLKDGFAYLAGEALHVLNVSDPTHPRPVGYLQTGQVSDMAVAGNYVYLGESPRFFEDTGGGLRVVDVSDPTRPTEVGFLNIPKLYAWSLAVAGSYAYLTSTNSGRLHIIDVSNAANPVEVGFFPLRPGHYAVAVSGRYAFFSTGGGAMIVVDVSDPTKPTEISAHDAGGGSNAAAVFGRFVFVANGGLAIVTVNNPMRPRLVGSCCSWGLQDLVVSGRYVFAAGVYGWLHVIDVSNPARPTSVASYHTRGVSSGIDAVGNDIYLADGWNGLVVLRFMGYQSFLPLTLAGQADDLGSESEQ